MFWAGRYVFHMARTEATIQAAITNLENLLDTGATSTNIDGESVTFSPEAARVRLKDLRNELAEVQGVARPRPSFGFIDMRG